MLQQGDVFSLFEVDDENGRLFWKQPPFNHPRLAGAEAGGARISRHGKLYWVIKVRGRAYKRARIMFLAVHGRFPRPCVDHINGNSIDDRPVNLREATAADNNKNRKPRMFRNLPMGVRETKYGRFTARLRTDGKLIHLGSYASIEEAHAVYSAKRREAFCEFA
jgi:hypothetical protein